MLNENNPAARDSAILEVRGVEKRFGRLPVLDEISFSLRRNGFLALLGASGCGKSTLLSILGGVESSSGGTVSFHGTDPSRRMLMFQQDGLFPWRTLARNVALGLEYRGDAPEAVDDAVDEALTSVGLKGFEEYYPHQLSGGMRQRAALARALVMKPELLLLDEPFGALDAITRLKMNQDLLRLSRTMEKSVVMVTHDVDEALFLADRIIVLSSRPGRIVLDLEPEGSRPRTGRNPEYAEQRHSLLAALEVE